MIPLPRLRSKGSRAMLAALTVCLVVDAVQLRRALVQEDVDTAARALDIAPPRLGGPWSDTASQTDDTIPDDPFDPARSEVVQTGTASAAADTTPAPSLPVFLVGTVVRVGSDGIAVCRMGDQPPRMIRVGERIGDLTLLTVEQGRASFRNTNGAPVQLRIATPGA